MAAIGAVMLAGAQPALAATITVDTTADDFGSDMAHCSLREAIKSVDGVSGGAVSGTNFGGCVASGAYATSVDPPDTIMVPAGTDQLTLPGSAEDSDASGDLDVFRSMNIVGTGNPTIQQTVAGSRVLDVTATGKDLSLSGLTITGGDQGSAGNGGGIHFGGAAGTASLTLDGVTVTDNDTAAGGNGGGVWTDSPTMITNSVISGNRAAETSGNGDGGGIYQDGASGSFTGVTLDLENSTVTGNFAGTSPNVGEGGGIFRMTTAGDATSDASIQSSDVSGNTARNSGGGINSSSDGTLTVIESLISRNHALTQRAGGIIVTSVQSPGSGTAKIVDSTITGNDSNQDGGGIQGGAEGFPINLELLFSTLAGNTGGPGSELNFSGNSGPTPSYTVEGTLFAATNTGLADACSIDGTNFVNTTDAGYNISTDPTDPVGTMTGSDGCGLSAPLPDGDRTGLAGPLLDPLAESGGPTKTMQPTVSSFATDNMPNSVCTALTPAVTTDQRGYPRPDSSGGSCDSGAYEAFTCSGTILNAPGPFSGCPVTPPPTGGGGGGASPTSPSTPKKKCKKKKKHRAAAAKKCKKKK